MGKPPRFTLLFFDDWYLHRRDNLVRCIGKPRLIPEGTFQDPHLDASWAYPSVFRDPETKVWRCLYQGQLDRRFLKPGMRVRHAAVAVESDDGVRWKIQNLEKIIEIPNRLCPHQVLPTEGFREWGPCFYDRRAENQAERIKGFVCFIDDDSAFSGEAPLHFSPDGLHWKRAKDLTWHPSGIDPAVSAFWNPYRDCYTIAARPRWGDRRISLYETRDWRTFSAPRVAVRTDGLDSPAAEIYGMPVFQYESIFVGFLWIYHVTPVVDTAHKYRFGKVDCQLAYSYNGDHFQRSLREPFLPNAEPGEFGYGCIYPSSMVKTENNKIRIYSSSSKGEHAQIHSRPDLGQSALLCHELRLDGFVYLESCGGPGSFTTRPLYISGENLTVNVSVPEGEVRAQITDPDGNPHTGYSYEDCIPFSGDDLFWRPMWKEQRRISHFIGNVVRLEVTLFNGRIYGLRGDFKPIQLMQFRRFKTQGTEPDPIYEY
jgi:hypothetical protein